MRSYKQITYEERVKVAQLKQSGLSARKIALAIGRPPSAVSRELRRNQAPPGEYWPDTAQAMTLARRKRGCVLDRNAALRDFVVSRLCCHYWTPEQIAGHLRRRQQILRPVSHETICSWICQKAQKKEKLWSRKARRGMRKSSGAGVSRIPGRVSVHERPKAVENRKDFGHWEGDLMSFMKNSQHILVLRERKTMMTLSVPLESKKASGASQAIIGLLKGLPPEARKTVTFDNGGEFAGHETVCTAIGIKSFFCDPYASWQKGGVENTNGRLRRDFPRKTDIKAMPKEEFDESIENYNMTPRKNLRWLTPLEAFNKNLSRVALRA